MENYRLSKYNISKNTLLFLSFTLFFSGFYEVRNIRNIPCRKFRLICRKIVLGFTIIRNIFVSFILFEIF